jgi:proteasome lid subunit RPN8/RPN11
MKNFIRKLTKSAPEEIRMTLAVYEKIRNTIGASRAETGGMLGGDIKNGTITHFFYDKNASRSAVTYSPDTETVNRLLTEDWNPAGVRLVGFVHSHPASFFRPSGGDEIYAARILAHNKEQKFMVLPIVQSSADTREFAMRTFIACRDGSGACVERVRLVIVEEEESENKSVEKSAVAGGTNGEHYDQTSQDKKRAPEETPRSYTHLSAAHQTLIRSTMPLCAPSVVEAAPNMTETFRRVRTAYDLDRMSRCRVVYVAVGGAAGFAEDMARAGLGEHIIIEPDVVSESNICTQQAYRRDIGKPKAECVAARIVDINPAAKVVTRKQFLDEIDDDEFKRLALAPFPGRPAPEVVVVCGFTDAFPPQARVNRLGLKFSLPTLCAQVYREGRAAEISFTYPGLTPACHRCILSARYKAYLNDGFKNDVTSDGTPIFSTTRLNAIKGMIMLGILHHGTNHPRWGGLLQRIGNRNLVQIRLDPDVESTLGIQNFSEAFRGADPKQIFADEAIWRPQLQECPATGYAMACPDCGGTGDLRDAFGRFADTRIMPI